MSKSTADAKEKQFPQAVRTFVDAAGAKRAEYQLPSGGTLSIKVPCILDLTTLEEVREANPDRGIHQVVKMLEHLGVTNLQELPASDFSYVASILESFFG